MLRSRRCGLTSTEKGDSWKGNVHSGQSREWGTLERNRKVKSALDSIGDEVHGERANAIMAQSYYGRNSKGKVMST